MGAGNPEEVVDLARRYIVALESLGPYARLSARFTVEEVEDLARDMFANGAGYATLAAPDKRHAERVARLIREVLERA